jgi:hypothetical protein
VANLRPSVTYTFHIVNFQKRDTLWQYGLKPLVCVPGRGWARIPDCGNGVGYYRVPEEAAAGGDGEGYVRLLETPESPHPHAASPLHQHVPMVIFAPYCGLLCNAPQAKIRPHVLLPHSGRGVRRLLCSCVPVRDQHDATVPTALSGCA